MADETNQQSSAEGQSSDKPAEGESQEPETSGASTLEEVEAYWRKRMSNSDKAHSAAEKALREQMEAKSAAEAGSGTANEVQPEVLKQLQERLQAAESRATTAELKQKYPAAVEAVGDAAHQMDEARLAALNESLNFDASAPKKIVDTNNPARKVEGQKPLDEMSIEELQAHLATQKSPWG